MSKQHIVHSTGEVLEGTKLLEAARQGVQFKWIPKIQPSKNPDFSKISGKSEPLPIDCCSQCAPMIWEHAQKAEVPYKCTWCGNTEEYVLSRKKIKRWW